MNDRSGSVFNSILTFDRKAEPTLYEIVGCSPESSIEQISKEYKIRALQLHPDKCNGFESPEFRQLQRARETLLDAKKRSIYDQWLHSGLAIDFEQFKSRFQDNCAGFHWINRRTNPMLPGDAPANDQSSTQQMNQNESNLSNSTSGTFEWISDTPNDLINKFRSYEI